MERQVHRRRVLFSAASLLALCTLANAQSNPLYEQRRLAARGAHAESVREDTFVVHADGGRTTLRMASSRLIDAGVKSGDLMLIDLGTMSIAAHVAFRDELERSARYRTETQEPGSVDPGPFLVLDRLDSPQWVVLSTAIDDESMYLDVSPGSPVSLRAAGRRWVTTRRSR